jgi:acetoin utilization protein AcuC
LAKILHGTVHADCGGRWVATGGGGYQAETVVPKVWAMYFAEMCGAPDVIPGDWLEDVPSDEVARSNRAAIEQSVKLVLERCLGPLSRLAADA